MTKSKMASTILMLALAPMAATASFNVDGRFGGVSEGYSLGYNIGFAVEGESGLVEGGRIFFGTQETGSDAGHYLYFAMPKDFVDNTWGENSVGWGSKEHTLKALVGSDSLGRNEKFVLNPVNAGGSIELAVDYLATDNNKDPSFFRSGGIGTVEANGQDNTGLQKNEGEVAAGDASGVLEIATSAEYNITNLVPQSDIDNSTDKNPTGLLLDSPDVLVNSDGDAVDANGNLLEAGDDYVCADAQDAVCNDWIFEVAYEFRFDLSMFDDGWTDPNQALSLVNGQTALTFVDLGEAHVSPNKGADFVDTVVGDCILGEHPECPPGDDNQPPGVPEPATAAMLGISLLSLGALRRRRQRV